MQTGIYELINNLTKEGLGILMISSEMEEIMGIVRSYADYVEGKVVGELQNQSFHKIGF